MLYGDGFGVPWYGGDAKPHTSGRGLSYWRPVRRDVRQLPRRRRRNERPGGPYAREHLVHEQEPTRHVREVDAIHCAAEKLAQECAGRAVDRNGLMICLLPLLSAQIAEW